MPCQLMSYEAKSGSTVLYFGTKSSAFQPLTPLYSHNHDIFYVCFDIMYSGEYNAFDATLSIYIYIYILFIGNGGSCSRGSGAPGPGLETHLAEHWTNVSKEAGSIPIVVRILFILPGVHDIHSE